MDLVPLKSGSLGRTAKANDNTVVVDPNMLLEAFDSMKPEMKTFMMYQFLRRCARRALGSVGEEHLGRSVRRG